MKRYGVWIFLFVAGVTVFTGCGESTTQEETFAVTTVSDGDTVTLDNALRVRLACIDAPERDQAFGDEATEALEGLIDARSVRLEQVDVDRYERTVGYLYRDGNNEALNLAMVRNGYAWVYRAYCDRCDYYEAERYAHDHRLGLWAQGDAVAPWLWRQGEREPTDYEALPDVCAP